MSGLARASKLVFRLTALVFIAGAASACSSTPDWVDPTTWVSSGSDEPETTASDTSAPAVPAGSEGKTVAEASDKYPVLADTPDKAPATASTDDQKQVANGLVADRTQAQYSAEALRAGTEPVAPPPPPPGAEPALPPPSETPAASAEAAPAASAPQTAAAQPQTSTSMPGTLPSEGEGAAPSPPPRVASATPPASRPAAPSPPAAPASVPRPSPAPAVQMSSSDAALGFQPSHAPPLDPGIAQLMSSPSHARGRQLAAIAPAALPPAPAAPSGPATAVVVFAQDTTVLNDEGRTQVKNVAEAFRKGGQGYIRVVGHSSAGGKLAPERKMVVDLERSQARANAVARELIKEGVPAGKVLVQAVGDTHSGTDGERRADIFVQS
jgi:outer membrane protein OmpA-like peptidoglycan-associated protein